MLAQSYEAFDLAEGSARRTCPSHGVRGYLSCESRSVGLGAGAKLPTEVRSSYVTAGTHNRSIKLSCSWRVWIKGRYVVRQGRHGRLSATRGHRSRPERWCRCLRLRVLRSKFGRAPSIVDLADQLRGELDDHRVFEDRRNHSLAHGIEGGIIVRQFILNRQERMAKIPMLFFYATPTNGSDLAAIARLASVNPQFRGLVPLEGNDLLRPIQSTVARLDDQSIASYCAVEDLPTLGIMIVTRSSATSLCNRAINPLWRTT